MFRTGSVAVALPIMLVGWLGVFLVIVLIVGAVYLLQALTRKKSAEKAK